MAYTTFSFLLFTVIVTAVYYLFPVKKYQWTVLLAANYYFYLCTGIKFAAFILFTTFTIYAAARAIEQVQVTVKQRLKNAGASLDREGKKALKAQAKSRQKAYMILALIANFGILVFLKYTNYIFGNINLLFGSADGTGPLPFLHLILPLGISFYTFQAAGYLIDVYRGTIQAEKNLLKFALFISFFPQIVQGPISSFAQLAPQLTAEHRPEFVRFKHGLELILWGLFKKLVIADRAVIAISTLTADYTQYCGPAILWTALLYALQLYADFSAGIDISRGIAQILGIDMIQNFRRPYFAESINDYWRRWHISLGEWMKNYIFYPVAMSKLFLGWSKKMKQSAFGKTAAGAHIAKVLPTSISSLIVFLVVGIWHGANSRYIAFGLWNGGIIMLSILLKPVFDYLCQILRIRTESFAWRAFRMARTFILVLIGYYFDIAPGYHGAMDMLARSIFDHNIALGREQFFSLGLGRNDFIVLLICTVVLFIVSVLQERNHIDEPGELLDRCGYGLQVVVIVIIAVMTVCWGIYGPGYDPAEFVYMQF